MPFVVLMMIAMNLRGVKESVMTLLPIFLAFVLMHTWLIGYALLSRGAQLPQLMHQAVAQAHGNVARIRVDRAAGDFLSRLLDGRRHLYRHRGGQQRPADFARAENR